jgi:hypothetical protein
MFFSAKLGPQQQPDNEEDDEEASEDVAMTSRTGKLLSAFPLSPLTAPSVGIHALLGPTPPSAAAKAETTPPSQPLRPLGHTQPSGRGPIRAISSRDTPKTPSLAFSPRAVSSTGHCLDGNRFLVMGAPPPLTSGRNRQQDVRQRNPSRWSKDHLPKTCCSPRGRRTAAGIPTPYRSPSRPSSAGDPFHPHLCSDSKASRRYFTTSGSKLNRQEMQLAAYQKILPSILSGQEQTPIHINLTGDSAPIVVGPPSYPHSEGLHVGGRASKISSRTCRPCRPGRCCYRFREFTLPVD